MHKQLEIASQENYHEVVFDDSYLHRQVVLFWSPWDEESDAYLPIVSAVVDELPEIVHLVTINALDNQEVLEKFHVTGYPHISIVCRGKILDQLVGAHAKEELKEWLEKHLGEIKTLSLSDIRKLILAGDPDAKKILETYYLRHQHDEAAQFEYGMSVVFDEPKLAKRLFAGIHFGTVDLNRYTRARIFLEAAELPEEDAPSSLMMHQIRHDVSTLNYEDAVLLLLEEMRMDRSYHNNLPQRMVLALFQELGTDHPVTIKYFPLYDRILY